MFETLKEKADKKRQQDKDIIADYKNGQTPEQLSFKYRITRNLILKVLRGEKP